MIKPIPGGIHIKSECATGTRVSSLNRNTKGFVSRCQRSRIRCEFINTQNLTDTQTNINNEGGAFIALDRNRISARLRVVDYALSLCRKFVFSSRRL